MRGNRAQTAAAMGIMLLLLWPCSANADDGVGLWLATHELRGDAFVSDVAFELEGVSDVALADDGGMVVAAKGEAWWVTGPTGAIREKLEACDGDREVRAVALHEGRRVVVVCTSEMATLTQGPDGTWVRTVLATWETTPQHWAAGALVVVVDKQGKVRAYDLTGVVVDEWEAAGPVHAVTVSTRAPVVATITDDEELQVRRAGQTRALGFDVSWRSPLALSSDGQRVFTAGFTSGGTVRRTEDLEYVAGGDADGSVATIIGTGPAVVTAAAFEAEYIRVDGAPAIPKNLARDTDLLVSSPSGGRVCFVTKKRVWCLRYDATADATLRAAEMGEHVERWGTYISWDLDDPADDLASEWQLPTLAQVLLLSSMFATVAVAPAGLVPLNDDIDYIEALGISGVAAVGVFSFGIGAMLLWAGIEMVEGAGDMMRSASNVPIIGPIIMIPIAFIVAVVGVAAAGTGGILALGAPATTGWLMVVADNAVGERVANPWTTGLSAIGGLVVGFGGTLLVTTNADMDLDAAILVSTGVGLLTTTLAYGLARQSRGGNANEPVMMTVPLVAF